MSKSTRDAAFDLAMRDSAFGRVPKAKHSTRALPSPFNEAIQEEVRFTLYGSPPAPRHRAEPDLKPVEL